MFHHTLAPPLPPPLPAGMGTGAVVARVPPPLPPGVGPAPVFEVRANRAPPPLPPGYGPPPIGATLPAFQASPLPNRPAILPLLPPIAPPPAPVPVVPSTPVRLAPPVPQDLIAGLHAAAAGRFSAAPAAMVTAAAGILPKGFARDPKMWADRVLAVLGEQALVGGTVITDLSRILALPVIPEGAPRCPDPEAYAATLRNHLAPPDFSFRPLQLDGIWEYETTGGLISPLGVGHGKTILSVGVAKVGLQRRGHHRAMLLVPPEVVSQLVKTDLPKIRRWMALDGIPIWHVTGNASERRRICSQPGNGLWIYTYSLFSQPSGEDEVRAIAPTLIICDEAHNVSRKTSTRTRRFIHLYEDMEKALLAKKLPETSAEHVELVALSGTITRRSLKDYAHLSNMSLVNASPIPFYGETVRLLSLAIDADRGGEGATMTEHERLQVERYRHWARDVLGYDYYDAKYQNYTWSDMIREAYQKRLRCSPGVVGSSDAGVEASLILSWSEPPRPKGADGELMVTLMRRIAEEMKTPDGDEIDFGMHSFKWYWELSAGFYNSFRWPTVQEVMRSAASKGKVCTEDQALGAIEFAKQHHALKQLYHVELRKFLKGRRLPKCDSPMLVANELKWQLVEKKTARHSLPGDLKVAYLNMIAAEYADLPARRRLPTRVCDYKVKAAVEWARQHSKENEGGFIWYHHPEIGEWLCELLKEEDIPFTYAPAGDNDSPFVDGIVVASYAHGTGKNLQHQCRNLFLELPDSAQTMEQTIGRTHRAGQTADDVRCDVFVSNGFDLAYFNHLLRDADYIQMSTGTQQRLCYATYSPIVPPVNARLIERLGIVDDGKVIVTPNVQAHESLTPPEALDWSSVFRSALYVSKPSTPGP